jgi:hypothetical protein
LGSLHELWERHRDQVDFVVVYIREAHPEEGWVVTMNRDQDILVNDPTSDGERAEVAATCAVRLEIQMPVVVDKVDDEIARAYGALPDRLYLIGRGGRVAFQGEPGPFGFKPEALATAIEHELRAS